MVLYFKPYRFELIFKSNDSKFEQMFKWSINEALKLYHLFLLFLFLTHRRSIFLTFICNHLKVSVASNSLINSFLEIKVSKIFEI